MALSTERNLALSPAGYTSDRTFGRFTSAMIASTTFHELPDLISANTHIDPYIRMREYDSTCTSRTNWFDLARICCALSRHEPLNPFESVEGLLNTEVDDLILPAFFWEQSDVPSPWNIHWVEAAAYGGGLELDDPVCGSNRTKYWGAHTWFDCNPESPCECKGHNCLGTHSTEGRAPAAAATAKPAPVPSIGIGPPTPTPSEIDVYKWQW